MKILFVGLGSIGQRHLRNIKKFYPNSKISAYRILNRKFTLSNKNKVQKDNLNKKYNIKVFKNFKESLHDKPDAIFICNPTSMHIKYALIAAKNKINIFIDKPLSDKMIGIRKLHNLVKKNEIIFMVGYQMRFLKSLIYIKSIIDKKILGKLCGANIYNGEFLPDMHKYENYRKTTMALKRLGGGVINSQIHELDYCIYLFGNPKTVYAKGGKLSNFNIDVEDYVTSSMTFQKDNISVNLNLDFFQKPPVRKMFITGTKASLEWNYYKNEVYINYYSSNNRIRKDFGIFNRNKMFEEQTKYFFSLISKKQKKNISDLDNGILSLKLSLLIKKSIKKNLLIKF
tara:strand:+ start:550 stop:1575 length:1026 start_codon:yes stop_codon:yes gene_type:complete